MGVPQGIARIVLVVINVVFFLLGLALLVIGCLVKTGSSLLNQYIKPLLAHVPSGAAGNVNLKSLLEGVATGFIILGVFIFVIGFLGCCGAMCKFRILILVYGVLVLVVIIGQIICVALVATMKSKVTDTLKGALKSSIAENFQGSRNTTELAGLNAIGLAWAYVFYELECCGVDGYEDLNAATKWTRNYTFGSGKTRTSIYLKAPVFCCKGITGTFPDVKLPPITCATDPTETTSNYEKGCYDAVVDFLKGQSTIVIATAVVIAVVEVACMVAAFCLFSAWTIEGIL